MTDVAAVRDPSRTSASATPLLSVSQLTKHFPIKRGLFGRDGGRVRAVDGVSLAGVLRVPGRSRGIVLFAHGSGSTHASPRNAAVAAVLEQGGFATLRFDLLTPAEALDRGNVFDIELLAGRLRGATRWVARRINIFRGVSAAQSFWASLMASLRSRLPS